MAIDTSCDMRFRCLFFVILCLFIGANSTGEAAEGGRETTTMLPGIINDLAVADSGRLIAIQCQGSNDIHIYNLEEGAIVRTLPINGVCRFAAGGDRLVVVYPETRLLQVWNLRDGKKLASASSPWGEGEPMVIAMNSSVSSRAFMRIKKTGNLYCNVMANTANVKECEITEDINGGNLADSYCRISGDGKLVATWDGYYSPNIFSWPQQKQKPEGTYKTTILEKEGGCFFTPNNNVVTSVGNVYESSFRLGGRCQHCVLIPLSNEQLITVGDDGVMDIRSGNAADLQCRLGLFPDWPIPNDELPTGISINDFLPMVRGYSRITPRLALDQRIIADVEHGKIAYIPFLNDRIVRRNFSFDTITDAVQTVSFSSSPPLTVSPGGHWTYQPKTAPSPLLRLDIVSAPPGMISDESGKISWDISEVRLSGQYSVVLLATVGDGRQAMQQFTLTIGGVEKSVSVLPVPTADESIPGIFPGIEADAHMAPAKNGKGTWLLRGKRVDFLDAAGMNSLYTFGLAEKYRGIADRGDYLILLGNTYVDFIDSRTGNKLKRITVDGDRISSFALDPMRSVTYVSAKKSDLELDTFEQNQIAIIDENGGRSYPLVGCWGESVVVHPKGGVIYTCGVATFKRACALLLKTNRGNFILPKIVRDDVGVMMKYQITGLTANLKQINATMGGHLKQFHISPDARFLCLEEQNADPRCLRLKGVIGWDAEDIESVLLDLPESAYNAVIHPELNLAYVNGWLWDGTMSRRLKVFNNSGNCTGMDPNIDYGYLFSADGKHLFSAAYNPELGGKGAVITSSILPLDTEDYKRLESWRGENVKSQTDLATKTDVKAMPTPTNVDQTMPDLTPVQLPKSAFVCFGAVKSQKLSPSELSDQYAEAVGTLLTGDTSISAVYVGPHHIISCLPNLSHDAKNLQFRHVVRGSRSPLLCHAKLLAIDKETGLSLLEVTGKSPGNFPVLAAGSSWNMGDSIVAMGSPNIGSEVLEGSMSSGIVSNPRRQIKNMDFIQITAAVTAGFEGGPVLNAYGSMVGLVIAQGEIEGAGFAIPANAVRAFLLKQQVP